MKKMLLRLFVSMLLLVAFMPSGSRAASYTIEVNDTAFSPDTLSILVGDTITWVWISGSHTVTSNGIPPGAAPFNELLDSLHTSFTYKVIFEGTYNYISVPDIPSLQGKFVASYPIGISTPLLNTLEFNLLSNPVQDVVTLRFSVPAAQKAAIVLYNISGMKEATLLDEILPAGEYSRNFELEKNLPPGMYLVTVLYGQQRITRKMISE